MKKGSEKKYFLAEAINNYQPWRFLFIKVMDEMVFYT